MATSLRRSCALDPEILTRHPGRPTALQVGSLALSGRSRVLPPPVQSPQRISTPLPVLTRPPHWPSAPVRRRHDGCPASPVRSSRSWHFEAHAGTPVPGHQTLFTGHARGRHRVDGERVALRRERAVKAIATAATRNLPIPEHHGESATDLRADHGLSPVVVTRHLLPRAVITVWRHGRPDRRSHFRYEVIST